MDELKELDTFIGMTEEAELKRAQPWEPISDDYLSAREFLSLMGIHGRSKGYRRALGNLRLAATGSAIVYDLPDLLKDCFRGGLVNVYPFRGSTGGTVPIEYRIPLPSLSEGYLYLAKKLIAARHSKHPYTIRISREAFKGLTVVRKKTGKSTSELLRHGCARNGNASLRMYPKDTGLPATRYTTSPCPSYRHDELPLPP